MIRPLRDEDVVEVAGIWRACRVDGLFTEGGLRHLFATMPARARAGHWVAERDDGSVCGYAVAYRRWRRSSAAAFAWVAVPPDSRGRGLGGRLWEHALGHARTIGVEHVTTDVLEPSGEGFARARGFVPSATDWISCLDPRTVDPAEFDMRLAAALGEGYDVAPLRDADLGALFKLETNAANDEPSTDEARSLTFEEWRAELVDVPEVDTEASTVVLHEGRPVAYSILAVDRIGRRARTEGTGTAREHRRRGCALLAKLGTIRWAAEHGIEAMITDNSDANDAMLALNARLGYRAIAERQRWTLDLSAGGTAS